MVKSFAFCVASVLACLLVAIFALPYATISSAQLEASRTPIGAEELGEVDLGDFGSVSVLELVDYYLENPPPEPSGEAPRQVRFQGC